MRYLREVFIQMILLSGLLLIIAFVFMEGVDSIPTLLLIFGAIGLIASAAPYLSNPSNTTMDTGGHVSRTFSFFNAMGHKETVKDRLSNPYPPIGIVGAIFILVYWVLVNYTSMR